MAWDLSLHPEVWTDGNKILNGNHRVQMESIIDKLYASDVDIDVGSMKEIFWNEFKQFRYRTGCFGDKYSWNVPHEVQGKSHLWHEKYSLPHTEVLGKIGCHVTSKLLGIGSAERAWGDVKHLKKDKPSHMGSQRLSKKVIIYTTASLNESRLLQKSKQDDDN